jgi:F0F1-type ATP synthase membrane subunit a
VAIVQTLVFILLSMAYFAGALEGHEHEEHEG